MAVRVLASQAYPQVGTIGSPAISNSPGTAAGSDRDPDSESGSQAATAGSNAVLRGNGRHPVAASAPGGWSSRFTHFGFNARNHAWIPGTNRQRLWPERPATPPAPCGTRPAGG